LERQVYRNVGEIEVDQTDANPGTDYKDICWQDGRRIDSIVELKTLAEQLNVCDGCDTPLRGYMCLFFSYRTKTVHFS
jgi:hypothetical protein